MRHDAASDHRGLQLDLLGLLDVPEEVPLDSG